MLKRTLVFSSPMILSLKNQQLVIAYKEFPDEKRTVPIEDMSVERDKCIKYAIFAMSFERLNSYHIMWLFVMFDLPVITKKERKDAALFRKNLEKDGFTMHQFSVYIRYCGSLESAQVHIKRVKSITPEKGHVSVLSITDKQYSNIIHIWGAIEKKIRPTSLQLEFF